MIDLPANPVDGQEVTFDDRTWQWAAGVGGHIGAWNMKPVSEGDANLAAAAASTAVAARNAAQTAQGKAQQWATKTDGEVEPGQGRGAKYYSEQAAATLADRPTRAELDAAGGAEQLIGGVAFNPDAIGGKKLGMLGAAVRVAVDGSVSLISDTLHLPVGIKSVELIDAYSLRVHYEHGFSEVAAILGTSDNDLAPYGLTIHASVTPDYATFTAYAPLIFSATGNGAITQIAPFWSDEVELSAAGSSSVVFLKPQGLNTNGPQITPMTSGLPILLSAGWGPTAVTISAVSLPIGGAGRIVYTGGIFVLSAATVSGMSVAASGGGAVVITHPDIGGNPDRFGQRTNSPLDPDLLTYGNTTTTFQFRKPDGSVATTAVDGADMKFNFKIAGLTPVALMPAAAAFIVDCGLCRVRFAQLGKVSLNNLWITGFMNKS